MSQFFGTDGIRGRVGVAPITADVFLHIGWAVGSVLAKKDKASVIIGKDTRASGYLFESALEAGFLSAGVDVGLLGPMPTPAIAYLTKEYSASAGVVISASHNHFQDNGVKFFSAEGFKFSDKEQAQIEEKLNMPIESVSSEKIGKAIRHERAIEKYINFCTHSITPNVSFSGLNIVIDCANGATYHLAKSIFSELGAHTTVINNQPDGFNINLDCGATNLQDLAQTVVKQKADLGIAFDGDGDRLMMVDHLGNVIDGDQIIFIIAKAWHAQKKLHKNILVGTKMTNLGARHAYRDLGIEFVEADVGDRFVLEQMKKHQAVLGGEGSGHIVCLNQTTTGDGIIAALQLLEVLVERGENLNTLSQEMEKYPQVLINVRTESKIDFQAHQPLQKAQKEVEALLGDDGRVLIRSSGTEPVIRVMVEGRDLQQVEHCAKLLADTLKR